VILAQEDDRWVVTLIGRFDVKPPEDMDGFIQFARGLDAPYIYDVVRNAEPIGEASTMRFPASVRRRYEKLQQLPKGFLTFGDAICSFNPAYGQGISVAALQAMALRRELSRGNSTDLVERFYKAASKVIDIPWGIAVGNDLKMPQARGKRTLVGRLLGWYIGKLHKLGHRDAQASVAFLRVAQLLDEPSALLQPKLALRVLTGGLVSETWFRLPQIKRVVDLPRSK
jgi:2-polyprenyl-6-methoxyphenol hydroxylase-like FAD-dependent oxidoreductase